MNKLNKIFLVVFIILTIALLTMTYYCFYWRNAYIRAVDEIIRILELNGGEIVTVIEDDYLNNIIEEMNT